MEGKKIREQRVNIGVSQSKLADITGINQARLSSYELGKSDLSNKEIKAIKYVINNLDKESLLKIKKKRITKNNKPKGAFYLPKRSYIKTKRNPEYLTQLKELELKFKTESNGLKAMSFFAGCGGLCYGVKAAGFEIVATNELVEGYKNVYKENFPSANFLPNDVQDITKDDLMKIVSKHNKIDLMVGGPPCQGFSLAGKRDVSDKRNTLFEDYLKIASVVKPKVVLIENVKLLTSMKDPNGEFVKDRIIDTFSKIGYSSKFFIVNAKNYGVAQDRERVIFIGLKEDIKKDIFLPEMIFSENGSLFNKNIPPFTFGDALSDLKYLESGEKDEKDQYHWAVKHPNHVLEWLADVPEGKSAHQNIDPKLRPPSGYNTTYKRQVWDKPAGTVATTFGMISGCRNVHPIATRAMTIREALRLQSFPDSFKLTGTKGNMRTVIGNAVPPLLGYHLASHIFNNYM